MWETPVLIFEDEDEEQLKADFVKYSALYPDRSPVEIANHVFRNLRDPVLRAGQAGLTWANDLEIREQIRLRKLQGEDDKEVDTKNKKLKVLEGIYNDENTSAKDKIAAIELHAKIQGEITKAIEQTNVNKRVPPQIVSAIGDFAHAPSGQSAPSDRLIN